MDEKERTAQAGKEDAAKPQNVLRKRGRPKGSKNKPKVRVKAPKRTFLVDGSEMDVFWKR